MKKLFLSMFLMIGTLSFANTGNVVKPIQTKVLWKCTVGDVTVDAGICQCDACERARAIYKAIHNV